MGSKSACLKRGTKFVETGRYTAWMLSMRFLLAISTVVLSVNCGAPPSQENTLAPAFDLPNIAGGRTTLASYQGKVVV